MNCMLLRNGLLRLVRSRKLHATRFLLSFRGESYFRRAPKDPRPSAQLASFIRISPFNAA
jgi:hypothetical protein